MKNTKHLIKMPSIGQFRNTIKEVNRQAEYIETQEDGTVIVDRHAKKPTITFIGTVKVHGTNAAICATKDEFWCQSKGNIITQGKDNAGFAFFIETHPDFETISERTKDLCDALRADEVCVYGEWAGKGVQKGVGISEIQKTFYPFGIKYLPQGEEDYIWVTHVDFNLELFTEGLDRITSIFDFGVYNVTIDFNDPIDVVEQNKTR